MPDHLTEPGEVDDPFGRIVGSTLKGLLLAPVLVVLAVGAHVLVNARWGRLPTEDPSSSRTFWQFLGISLLLGPVAGFCWAFLSRHRFGAEITGALTGVLCVEAYLRVDQLPVNTADRLLFLGVGAVLGVIGGIALRRQFAHAG